MNTWVVEFPSVCLRALQAGYSTCGPAYQDTHYSGNFWWARCDHVAELSPLRNRFDAHSAEWFLLRPSIDHGTNVRLAENCGYNPFHCRVNHYDLPCPRSRYRPALLASLQTPELAPNPTADFANKSLAFVGESCGLARSFPRAQKQQWWQKQTQITEEREKRKKELEQKLKAKEKQKGKP